MAQHAQPTREQKLAHWRSIGTDEAELKFLEQNPELIDFPDAAAAAEAQRQGHNRGTEAHMNATRELFHRQLENMKAQAAAQTPDFFKPQPAPAASAPSPASYTSASVSREVPSGYREPSPSQVRLSAEEKQIARASGISDVVYARNKLWLAGRRFAR